MPEFPKITPANPVIIPAQSERVYGELWLRKLEVYADFPTSPVRVVIEVVPSNGAEILNDQVIRNVIPDAFSLAAQDPEFAQALAAVIQMVDKYKYTKFEDK